MYYLAIAIVLEVVGTSFLKAADGFTNLIPSSLGVVGYLGSLYFLSLALRTVPLGLAYAVWSGVGIAALSLIGYFYYKQSIDVMGLVGIAMIVGGVLVIATLSKTL